MDSDVRMNSRCIFIPPIDMLSPPFSPKNHHSRLMILIFFFGLIRFLFFHGRFLEEGNFGREACSHTERGCSKVKIVIVLRVDEAVTNKGKHKKVCCELADRNEHEKCLPVEYERHG
jgi:hypothetical protein